jgi:ferrous iron transport protein B
MEFILVGQPNSGKSTIFNGVVGYKSEVANFPGVTVSYTRGNIYIDNQKIEVVDIPGTYSLQTTDEAEQVAVNYILKSPAESVIINIIDTSVLSRSLELTLQLMELKKPMVIALNMIDEADRKGIKVDIKKLSALTGLPVLKTIGTKGEGISELFKAAVFAAREQILPKTMEAPHDVERVIQNLLDILKNVRLPEQWNQRFLVLKLIEKDILVEKCLEKIIPVSKKKEIEKKIYILEKQHKGTSDLVISSVRHDTAFKIFEEVAQVGIPSRRDFREKIDDVLMHPILGYLGMIAILYVTFALNWFGHDSIFYAISNGAVQGFVGGIGIVLPYLFPFFIVFSILEGTGYLARIAYLIDSVMHRIGLHGLSVVPMILGYGCTVPGIMATRILKSKRDKFITAVLTTMVPCSARMIIILGLQVPFPYLLRF